MARRPKTIGARFWSNAEITFAVPCVPARVAPDLPCAAPSFAGPLEASSAGRVRLLSAVSRAVSITRQSEGRRRIFVSTFVRPTERTSPSLAARAARRIGPAFSSRGRID
ncbi:MAG: hypothetical protein ACKO1J_12360 [Tagaea sp.]